MHAATCRFPTACEKLKQQQKVYLNHIYAHVSIDAYCAIPIGDVLGRSVYIYIRSGLYVRRHVPIPDRLRTK